MKTALAIAAMLTLTVSATASPLSAWAGRVLRDPGAPTWKFNLADVIATEGEP